MLPPTAINRATPLIIISVAPPTGSLGVSDICVKGNNIGGVFAGSRVGVFGNRLEFATALALNHPAMLQPILAIVLAHPVLLRHLWAREVQFSHLCSLPKEFSLHKE
jgi:hypothetical protein